jgi:hypothetical protein
MNDYDSIKGIFMQKNNLTTEYTQNGFNFESNNDYYQARKCYQDGLNSIEKENSNVSDLEKGLWEESLLRCCNELTEWKYMYDFTMQEFESFPQVYLNSLENMFPYAFKSKLKIILQSDHQEQEKHGDLVDFFQSLDSEGKKYLEQAYCQELALIHLNQNDFNAAKYYAHLAIQKFLIVQLNFFL